MLFVVLFYFEMVSCRLGWPQINYIAQTGLDPPTPNPLNSTSQVLVLYIHHQCSVYKCLEI